MNKFITRYYTMRGHIQTLQAEVAEREGECPREQQDEEHDRDADRDPHDRVLGFGRGRLHRDQLIGHHFALRQRGTVFFA